jgi:hypothetical protein
MTTTTTPADLIATELRAIVPEDMLAEYVADDSGCVSLDCHRSLVRTRLGGDYEDSAWAAACESLRDTTAPTATLTATVSDDRWSVVDSEGGRWWPDAAARAEIEASDTPATTAVRICDSEPMRGTWHS